MVFTIPAYWFMSWQDILFIMISAVTNAVKFRKHNSPVLSASKIIQLAAALVSIFSLETAMIGRFGENEETFRRIMTGVSGAVVCAILLGMGTFMIIKSYRKSP